MLVVTRKPGQRVVIAGAGRHLVLEVGKLVSEKNALLCCEGLPGYGEQQHRVSVGRTWALTAGIIVHVHEVTRGQVKLGIEAPRDFSIDREEVYLSKKEGPKR